MIIGENERPQSIRAPVKAKASSPMAGQIGLGQTSCREKSSACCCCSPACRSSTPGAGLAAPSSYVSLLPHTAFKSTGSMSWGCATEHPLVRSFLLASLEDMRAVPAQAYDIVFANFVLEHLQHLEAAIGEIGRVLVNGGLFVATVPNPQAPEFVVARHTPDVLHRFFTPGAFETHYAFRNLDDLAARAGSLGFMLVSCSCPLPIVGHYLRNKGRLPAALGRACDKAIVQMGWGRFFGTALLAWRKGQIISITGRQ